METPRRSQIKRTDMLVKYERPPMYDEISKRFPLHPGVVFTWGAAIFDPNNHDGWRTLPVDLIEHEVVHANQQGDDPRPWWERYLIDDEWRLSQEMPAYQRQYRVWCSFTSNRNDRFSKLHKLAGDLSSPLYGSIIGHDEAMRTISA